jgi:hypothetical protein
MTANASKIEDPHVEKKQTGKRRNRGIYNI